MAYIVSIITTKPPLVAWFSQGSPLAEQTLVNIRKLVTESTGFLRSIRSKSNNPNSNETMFVFDSRENRQAFINLLFTNPDWLVHKQYDDAHGMVQTQMIID